MRSGEGDFGKLEFLAKFQTMRTQTFKKYLPSSQHSGTQD